MEKQDKPIGTLLRELNVGEHVLIPRRKVCAINSAINFQKLSLDRAFTRKLQPDKQTYLVTRIK